MSTEAGNGLMLEASVAELSDEGADEGKYKACQEG